MSCPDFLYFCSMYLKKIALLNFKNIEQEELTFCPGINCLVGDNGAGKTNIVDAVYYLSMCKSSLQMTDGQSIRHGADFFLVEGQYATDGGKSENVVCSFSRKGRQGAQTQRQGVRPAFGPRGTDPRRDRVAGRRGPDLRRGRRATPLPQRLHLAARPGLPQLGHALQRRPGRTEPAAEDAARRGDAANLRPPAHRTRRGDPRPAARGGGTVAARRRSLLPHALGRPRAGRAALPLGAERTAVRRDPARRAAEGPGQRVHHRGHSPRRPGAPHRRLPPAQIRLAGTAEILPDRPQAGAVRHRGPQQGRTAAAAARRSVRQTRRRPRRTAHPAGFGRDVRADPHHGLQPHPSENDTRQGRRGYLLYTVENGKARR